MDAISQPPSGAGGAELPFFLVSIDTEGDNIWAQPREVATQNAAFLYRFQVLCERYHLRPSYLTNYEMAMSPTFQEFGRHVLKQHTAEIGMHLHAWNTPPLVSLTADDTRYQPYLIEYPPQVMKDKVATMTDLLESTFGRKMVSHRAGRWGFDAYYARLLLEYRYRVDSTVTPYRSWKACPGDPAQAGGTDYSHFPDTAYFIDLSDIGRAGKSPLLEVPMTIIPAEPHAIDPIRRLCPQGSYEVKVMEHIFPIVHWLRPTGRNLRAMLRILQQARQGRWQYVQLMLHSSELMPGGSPTFRTANDIERLYADLEKVFAGVEGTFAGATFEEFYQAVQARQRRISHRTGGEQSG